MTAKTAKKTFTTTLVRDGSMCFIVVPFDPAAVFGRARAPVTVTLHGYTYRSTIAIMDGPKLPLRRSHREAAGLAGTETLRVTLALDTAPREVEAPPDLLAALREGKLLPAWRALSYSHQREHAEAIGGAVKPDTRARRIAAAVAMVGSKAATAVVTSPLRARPRRAR